ncbi:hypothetical protein Dimus_030758 [Dionaea muscipula]
MEQSKREIAACFVQSKKEREARLEQSNREFRARQEEIWQAWAKKVREQNQRRGRAMLKPSPAATRMVVTYPTVDGLDDKEEHDATRGNAHDSHGHTQPVKSPR